jgi:hypothetical protein
VTKTYDPPATPYERLLANDRVPDGCKNQLRHVFATLDAVELLNRIREAQQKVRQHEVGAGPDGPAEMNHDLTQFVASLSTAWQHGEVRPTHRKPATGPRTWRTRVDPFQDVWPVIEPWLKEQPDLTAKALLARLQSQTSMRFAAGQLRTMQRRVREWRTAVARRLVLGASTEAEMLPMPSGCECSADAEERDRAGANCSDLDRTA